MLNDLYNLSAASRAYFITLAALLGAVMGSFLNCLAWRLAHGESIVKGRSHCTACGHVLGVLDLVPVASWVCLRGRCRYCGERISARYPAAELICAAAWASVLARFGPGLACLRGLVLASVLLVAALVDWDEGWIPDRCVAFGCAAFVVFAALEDAPLAALGRGLLGALAVSVPLLALVLAADKLLGRESMGGGDLKLLFMIGLYFDWMQDLLALILACVLGLALAAVMGRARPNTPFPFGPALAAAGWVTLLAGEPVAAWYLGLFY